MAKITTAVGKRKWTKAQRAKAGKRMRAYWLARRSTPTPRLVRANGHAIDIDRVPAPILLSLTLLNQQELINFIAGIETQGFRIAEMRITKAG